MKNEKGFILPYTLMVTFLVFFVIFSSVQIYLSESKYLQETKGYYLKNSMIGLAMRTLIEQMENHHFLDRGMILFEEGNVSYQIEPIDDLRYRITLVTITSFGQQIKNQLLYDQSKKRISKWVEN